MLDDIKKELIKHPEKLQDVLEYFGYANIKIYPNRLQFGRDEDSSKKSIVIRLDGDGLYVTDYARNINKEFFSYITTQRNVQFVEVINEVKKSLGITDYYDFFGRKGIFGGFYERIKKRYCKDSIKILDNSILNKYVKAPNIRFLRDNISFEAQNFFDIRYDIESQGIVIPIHDQFGQLMGIKIRCNFEVADGEQKYWYLEPCAMSKTLYGYSQNYEYLVGDTIYIFESEKSVLQCCSYGIRNAVALGSGTISKQQIKLVFELHPKKIIFMHDNGYNMDFIKKNMNAVLNYSRFSEVKVGYWDWNKGDYPEKCSPSDLGKKELKRIIENEIVYINDEDDLDDEI